MAESTIKIDVVQYQEVPVLESANKCIELRLKWNESVNTGECWNMSKLSLCVVMFKE